MRNLCLEGRLWQCAIGLFSWSFIVHFFFFHSDSSERRRGLDQICRWHRAEIFANVVDSFWKWLPLILSLSISMWWFLLELELNCSPLESGLASVTHLTNRMWWSDILEFLRLGHLDSGGFCLDLLECFFQNTATRLWLAQINGEDTYGYHDQQSQLSSYAAASTNFQVYDRTTLNIAPRRTFRWLHSQLLSTWDALKEIHSLDPGPPAEPWDALSFGMVYYKAGGLL